MDADLIALALAVVVFIVGTQTYHRYHRPHSPVDGPGPASGANPQVDGDPDPDPDTEPDPWDGPTADDLPPAVSTTKAPNRVHRWIGRALDDGVPYTEIVRQGMRLTGLSEPSMKRAIRQVRTTRANAKADR